MHYKALFISLEQNLHRSEPVGACTSTFTVWICAMLILESLESETKRGWITMAFTVNCNKVLLVCWYWHRCARAVPKIPVEFSSLKASFETNQQIIRMTTLRNAV